MPKRNRDRLMRKPIYANLGDFMAARARGDVPRAARVVNWTSSGAVTIQSSYDGDGDCEEYYRAATLEAFALDFAAAIGLEGDIS